MTNEELALQARMLQGETVVVSMRGDRHKRLIAWARKEGRLRRIDRGTMWGNPYRMRHERDRNSVIRQYKAMLDKREDLLARSEDLAGGVALACWCAPKWCHGHVLAWLVNRLAT